ncbi:MAG TPA: hypothetical protein VFD04_14660, partial [Actinomycetes bacterium]|nr:hypothetical protein [Actinomycetes bacterium]
MRPRSGRAGPSGLGVELPAPAGSPLALAKPLLLWLRRRDGACRARRRGYATLERRSGGLLGRGAVAVPGAGDLLVEFEDRWAAHPRAGAVLDRRVTVRGADPRWTGFATGLELPVPGGDGDCLWFAPGVLYRRNQHAPAGAIGSAAAGERPWVREDRLALPLIARLAPALGWWLGLLHLDAVAATADGDDLAAELTAAELSFGAFAGPGGRALAFTYPGSEGPVSYPPMGTLEIANTQADSPVRPFPAGARPATGWARRWHPLAAEVAHRYRLLVLAGRARSYAAFERGAWRRAFAAYRPRRRPAPLREVELASLRLLAGSVTRDRDPAGGPVGIPTWTDCFGGGGGRLQDTFSAGTVGRNLEVAQVLLVAAEREGVAGWRRLAERIVRFWVGAGGHGLSHTDYDRRGGRWTDAGPAAGGGTFVFLRDQSEAHLSALRCYAHEAGRGRRHRDWLAWCRSYGDWLLGHRGPGGLPARAYRLDGTISDPSEHDGIHEVTFLAELAAASSRPAYLDAAVALGRRYWDRFHSADVFAGGTLDNRSYDISVCQSVLTVAPNGPGPPGPQRCPVRADGSCGPLGVALPA